MPQGRYKSMTDAELCRLADSDEEAYAELVSRYVGMVRRLVHVYSYNISDIDAVSYTHLTLPTNSRV